MNYFFSSKSEENTSLNSKNETQQQSQTLSLRTSQIRDSSEQILNENLWRIKNISSKSYHLQCSQVTPTSPQISISLSPEELQDFGTFSALVSIQPVMKEKFVLPRAEEILEEIDTVLKSPVDLFQQTVLPICQGLGVIGLSSNRPKFVSIANVAHVLSQIIDARKAYAAPTPYLESYLKLLIRNLITELTTMISRLEGSELDQLSVEMLKFSETTDKQTDSISQQDKKEWGKKGVGIAVGGVTLSSLGFGSVAYGVSKVGTAVVVAKVGSAVAFGGLGVALVAGGYGIYKISSYFSLSTLKVDCL